jgi:hypothetical protein
VHCLRPGKYDFTLPFECQVLNLKTYELEKTVGRILKLNLTAGETCRFWLGKDVASEWGQHIPELRRLADFHYEKVSEARKGLK